MRERLGRSVLVTLVGCVLVACSGSNGAAKQDASVVYGSGGANLPSSAQRSGSQLPTGAPSTAISGASSVGASTAGSSTSGSHPPTGGTTHSAASSTPPPTTHTSTHTVPPPPSCTPPTSSTPAVVVCPHAGLTNGQTVTVYASGFPKIASVVVIECADKGTATGQSDCNKINFAKTSASGSLTFRLPVYVQVSKTDRCSSAQPCLVSVTQPSLTHSYEADEHITFA